MNKFFLNKKIEKWSVDPFVFNIASLVCVHLLEAISNRSEWRHGTDKTTALREVIFYEKDGKRRGGEVIRALVTNPV